MPFPPVPRLQLQVRPAGDLTRAFWNNKFLLGAFAVGALLLAAVLLIPPLEPLFQVAELSAGLVGCIVGLAFGSMVVIQILKAIRSMGKK